MNEDEAKKWVKGKATQRKIIAACIGDSPRADNKSFAFWIVQKHGDPRLENAIITKRCY